MTVRYILTDYVNQLMAQAIYDKLEDGTFSGRIPSCKGVVAFGSTLRDCEEELRSTLEEWILVGLKLGHPLPVTAEINLNTMPTYEQVEAVLAARIHSTFKETWLSTQNFPSRHTRRQ